MAAQQWVQGMWGQMCSRRRLQKPWQAAITSSRAAMRGVPSSHHCTWKPGTLLHKLNSSCMSMASDSIACTAAPRTRHALTRWTLSLQHGATRHQAD